MIRWGIIGCGNVCEVKSGPAFSAIAGSSLVSVMRRDAAQARSYAERHGALRSTSDARAVLDDPEVDAVYVATPPGSHLEYALAAAERGKPCYVEKPMARSHAECRRMLDAFAAAETKLFVAYYRRCLPRFVGAKAILDGGDLGVIESVRVRHTKLPLSLAGPALPWRLRTELSGGGLFMDLGSHTLDLLDYLIGPLCDVRGSASRKDQRFSVEDGVTLVATIRKERASIAVNGSWDFCATEEEDVVEVKGTRGSLSFAMQSATPLVLRTAAGMQQLAIADPPHVQQPLIQTIVDDLIGHGACPSTGESAARTAQVMDRVLWDYYGGREHEFWK